MKYSKRLLVDYFYQRVMSILTWFCILSLFFIFGGLIYKSLPILTTYNISDLLLSSNWSPLKGNYGLLPFIISTFWVTGIAMVIAIPFCLLTSIYLSEYADQKVKFFFNPLIDILAGIPSIIFGIWGIILIVPFVRDYLAPAFGKTSTGYSILSGGIVLSVMVVPIMIHVLIEVFQTVSKGYKEASLSLGATKWQTIKNVLLKKSAPGIVSAIVLSLSRAFGETLAVLMVVGNTPHIPSSGFDRGYPLPALIANNYGEMMSVDLYDSALLLASLVLFMIVLFFNVIARIILRKMEKKLI